ncbi:unnamed protein product [Nesidiocoris tenuis]|uniref:Uncharacterized protein n=1 Tax=Nesidiocoris tenuis TaxID=355587 RepID=A0A6H5HR35_9HEMI|nr:unnamed protein product [Nesidiocoris tenuis]
MPTAERFTFCLNTLLSDIAAKCPDKQDEIISTQVKFLCDLTSLVRTTSPDSPKQQTAILKLSPSTDAIRTNFRVLCSGANQQQVQEYDPTTHYFCKYGSSFHQLPHMRMAAFAEKRPPISFPIAHLQICRRRSPKTCKNL